MKQAALAILLALTACASRPNGPVTIQTAPPKTICEAARVGGVLIADDHYGLAFKGNDGAIGVVWPNGYSARREDGVVVLIDPSGRTVAREGDGVEAAGAWGDRIAYPCTDLRLAASSNP